MECDFNTFLCGSCDYSSKVVTIITRSIQKCVKITFHFLQCRQVALLLLFSIRSTPLTLSVGIAGTPPGIAMIWPVHNELLYLTRIPLSLQEKIGDSCDTTWQTSELLVIVGTDTGYWPGMLQGKEGVAAYETSPIGQSSANRAM